jgi:diphosphomevalonate decarboxylase
VPARAERREAATFEAAPNIALIKYWGVRDPLRALPFNSSISVTLSGMKTRTTVRFDASLREDRLRLNGANVVGPPRDAVARFLDRVRARAELRVFAEVRSRNNFPTASGLASSASGFAALAGASARAAGLELTSPELSELARYGSGSACRSIFGGFVEWEMGTREDGTDSIARSLFPPEHWPELVDLVAVVAGAPEKAVRSAVAMQASVRTSPRYAPRLAALPARLRELRGALAARDAARLFELMIEECDEFRAVCESTDPPLDYLTPTSRQILEVVRARNAEAARPVVGYTHDAGAHVHLFTVKAELPRLRRALRGVPGIARFWTSRPGPGGRYAAAPVR